MSTINGVYGDGTYESKSEAVLASLHEIGFNDQEIAGQVPISATDARAAILAFKAAEFDRIMIESEAPKVRLGTKRKRIAPPRSQASGTGTRHGSSSGKQRDNYRKAVSSQKEDDWINVIKSRMNLG